jgi:ubiquinone/menaquinone biosynthesis C-methylase UbiE
MKEIKDNFSTGSANYASFRPTSPKELYKFLFQQVQGFDTAWDVGTGNGQVAAVLADHYQTVHATDISTAQLAKAVQKDNIIYKEQRAEQSSLPDKSIDLITVAQAFHWFDFEAFYKEVRRVAKPGCLLAIWTYNLLTIDNGIIDEVIDDFYFNTVGPYWDKERKYVDVGYKNIDIPFKELATPVFPMHYKWGLEQFLGYVGTWSSVQHYKDKENADPITILAAKLKHYWRDNEAKDIDFPVFMRLFRID